MVLLLIYAWDHCGQWLNTVTVVLRLFIGVAVVVLAVSIALDML